MAKNYEELTFSDDFMYEKVRENKKWRAEYMHTLVHEQDIRDEGIAIGRDEGITIGEQNSKLAIIRRLLQKNFSDSEIIDISDCTQEMIDHVKNEMK